MTAYLLINHLLNFLAPIAALALMVVLMTRIFYRSSKQKKHAKIGPGRQLLIVFAVNLTFFTAGLLLFGSDARMLSYFGMALGSAACLWRFVRA